MKATSGELPVGPGWAFELKWDGARLQATCHPEPEQGPPLVLRSSSGRVITSTYPELAGLPAAIGVEAVLDGEAVVFDQDRPSFARLQHRLHVAQPSAALVEGHPVVYMVFDLLSLGGRSTIELPYRTRRSVLSDLLAAGPSWRMPPSSPGHGLALLELATERGLEGVVSKKLTSRYQEGARSGDWIKTKVRKRQEFVVGGWLAGQGGLEGSIGSLVVGVWDDGGLRPCGAVGSGLTDLARRQLLDQLDPTPTCPFAPHPEVDRNPTWVEPHTVVEVEYDSWPPRGNLRHPVFLGLRLDHDPNDVVRELPP